MGKDWALTRGSYTTRFRPIGTTGDGAPPNVGKFLLLWERQANGEWKIILDMGNQNTTCGHATCAQ